jgi:hypothetical protein
MASPTGQTGKGKFPRQLVIMVTAETGELVDRLAAKHSLSKAEVARTFLEAGVKAGNAAVTSRGELAADPLERVTTTP